MKNGTLSSREPEFRSRRAPKHNADDQGPRAAHHSVWQGPATSAIPRHFQIRSDKALEVKTFSASLSSRSTLGIDFILDHIRVTYLPKPVAPRWNVAAYS